MDISETARYRYALLTIILLVKKKDIRLDLFEDICNIAERAVYGEKK